MSHLRPEAISAVLRWAEPVLVTLGTLWALGQFWAAESWLGWIGFIVTLVVGCGWAYAAFNRARLKGAKGGAGQVFVDEGQILYVGPLGTQGAAIDALSRIEIATNGPGREAFWMLTSPGTPPVSIPADAEGAAQILDALGVLPGVSRDAAIRRLNSPEKGIFTLWRREKAG